MRREWIEIADEWENLDSDQSPSMRREWIEINYLTGQRTRKVGSPSMRREWIEMGITLWRRDLHSRLPPCGGSGLKYCCSSGWESAILSPSMRREWIEMNSRSIMTSRKRSPSMRREWIEICHIPYCPP